MTRRTRPGSASVLTAVTALVCGVIASIALTAFPAGASGTFTNATAITVPDATCGPPSAPGKATPYPSTINVSGQTGTISDLNVTLHNLNSDYTGDLEVLLVGPSGGANNLILLSDAGQSASGLATNVTLVFDDSAAGRLGQNTDFGAPNSTVATKPVDYLEGSADVFPSPAPSSLNHPAPTGVNTLASVFNGQAPNGTWSLYVIDDACGDASDTFSGGWSLDFTTNSGAATTTAVSSSPNPSTTGQSVTFTATVTSSGSAVGTGTVTFSEGATTLAANQPVNASGVATFSTSALTEGDHTITATYNPGAAFATSSGSVHQRVDNATTNPSAGVYCNTGAITIPSNLNVTPAVPYPSHITVSGFSGTIGKVTAQLKNVTHPFTDDIDALLVGPNPTNNLVLVSDAPQNVTAGASNVSVTFDDAAGSFLPVGAAWGPPNGSITAKPTDYDPGAAVDTFPAPAPAPSSNTTLGGTFNGTDPNGTWSLYVVDDALGDTGSIGGGWCLTITPPPAPDLAVTKVDTPDPVVAGGNLTYTIGVSDTVAGSTAQSVVLSDPIPAHTTFVSLSSPAGWTCSPLPVVGSSGGTVTCTRPTLTPADGSQTFTLVVKVDLQTPSATPIQNTATVSSTPADTGAGANAASASSTVNFSPSLPAVVTGSVNWKLRNSLTTGGPDTTFIYGVKPLTPIMGDWDGNGTKTAGTFEGGVFKLNNANDSSGPDITFTFGDPRGFPVVGDWNGDGVDDVAVYKAGVWQTRLSVSGTVGSFNFGPALSWPTVVPVAGDWNGDGTDGIGLYNLMGGGTLGEWNLRQTIGAGGPDLTFTFGGSGQYPVVGDWNGDGVDGIGTKTTAGTTWSLRQTATAGAATVTFDYGAANDLPLVWRN
jgi:uncharacterized repeat protein (TIGR01451 family)